MGFRAIIQIETLTICRFEFPAVPFAYAQFVTAHSNLLSESVVLTEHLNWN